MEDMTTIVLYCTEEHLNSMLLLAIFFEKHHQTRASLSIIIICSAPYSVVASALEVSSITYHRLPTITLPPNAPTDIVELFFEVPRLQNPNLREALEEISKNTKIDAFIIDFFCNSAFEVSTSINIPTYFYYANGASNLCVGLYLPTIDETNVEDIGDLNEYIEVPGCPPVYSLDFPSSMFFRKNNASKNFLCMAKNTRKSSGVIVHGFDALEFRAKEALSNGLCNPDGNTPPVYFIGPLLEEVENSRTGDGGEHECLKWLDSQPSKSVLFLCFGRRGLFSAQQLREIANGLEKSGHRFLWSVRSPLGDSNSVKLLPEGFMERTKERGFVVKNWAPQKKVLSHGAVGGFVTHCGWSSIIEAVSFGVPMIGWPLYAEQKMTRVFMVEEMKVALSLEMDLEGFVTAVELEKQVKELMESNLTGRAIRSRVEEMKIAAEAATRKGGSSLIALEKFIESIQPRNV